MLYSKNGCGFSPRLLRLKGVNMLCPRCNKICSIVDANGISRSQRRSFGVLVKGVEEFVRCDCGYHMRLVNGRPEKITVNRIGHEKPVKVVKKDLSQVEQNIQSVEAGIEALFDSARGNIEETWADYAGQIMSDLFECQRCGKHERSVDHYSRARKRVCASCKQTMEKEYRYKQYVKLKKEFEGEVVGEDDEERFNRKLF